MAADAKVGRESLNKAGRRRLDRICDDYSEVRGRDVRTFFCPVLFRDELVTLCRAHLIPRAFRDSDRAWTIQRKDVDGFFGSLFEADFAALQEGGAHSATDVLRSPKLRRLLRPKLTVEGREVPFFAPGGEVPPEHSPAIVGGEEDFVPLVMKLSQSEAMELESGDWQLVVEKDIRLPALVSILKAAHLSLFHLMGYRYALSAAGRFVGWDVLGRFYLQAQSLERAEQIELARSHFREFVHLARPVLQVPSGFTGTVSDGRLFVCGAGHPWAMIVFVRTGDHYHAVLVPVLEHVRGAAHFAGHLKEPANELAVRLARYGDQQFEIAKTVQRIAWPDPRWED